MDVLIVKSDFDDFRHCCKFLVACPTLNPKSHNIYKIFSITDSVHVVSLLGYKNSPDMSRGFLSSFTFFLFTIFLIFNYFLMDTITFLGVKFI